MALALNYLGRRLLVFPERPLVVQPLDFDRLSNLHADLAQMSLPRKPVKSMRTDH
jgi:hypothetical protein